MLRADVAGRGLPAVQLLLVAAVAALLLPSAVRADAHSFKNGDKIPTYVNKVGPYFNTHETYHYYSLPVCRPTKIIQRSLTLGEVLDGDRMAEAMYDIRFREEVKNKELCKVSLSPADVEKLRAAIEELYYFEFVIDDLPVRGFIGQLEEHVLPHSHNIYLWTHMQFHLEFNGNQIVAANVSEKMKEIELAVPTPDGPNLDITFTYSVKWSENKQISFNKRNTHGKNFFPKTLEIHWLSIINSVVLVLLMTGFVAVILARAVNKDFARYSREEVDAELESELQDEQGWKIIHTDVFRFPQYKSLLCALLGTGTQFLALIICIIVMALLGLFNVHRHGSMNAAAVLVYALTCGVAGFVSGRLYKEMEGQNWVWNIVLTSCVFAVPFFLVWSVVNSVAWYQGSTQALPFFTILLIMIMWLAAGFPLTVVGGIMGKNSAAPFDAPCRTKNICREIPQAPCYRTAPVHLIIGGFLPFSAISVELYYIFATIWGREHYTLYGILLLVFFVLLAVTACTSVALCYFQLSSENYLWWWRSVFSAGFTGFFVFLYAAFYFQVRSNMSGMLQTVQFFGYTLLACYVFFLMLGAVGFYSSLKFVRYIYKNLKLD